MRFSAISPRFGHQLATSVLSRLVFEGNITNSVLFSTRLLLPSILVSFAPELALRDEIFHHTCAVWSSACNVLFRQCPFTQQISEKAYFLSRLLVSVDIGLVCSWVGVPGWDFPPYLRGFGHQFAMFCFDNVRLRSRYGHPTLSGTPWRPPRSSMEAHGGLHGGSWSSMEAPWRLHGGPWRPPWRSVKAPWRSVEISHHICAVWSSICNVLFRQCLFTQQIS